MHRIDTDGATNDNQFTEGDPQSNVPATVVGADWLNDTVQEELCQVVEASGLTLVKAQNDQLLKALRIMFREQLPSQKVGKLEWYDDYFSPAADFPYLCLTDADAVLTTTNWPVLVPYLRAKKVRYKANLTGAKTAFDVTNFSRTSGVVTLTLANTAAEIALVKALAEDNLVHGSYTNWRTITTTALISDVPVGDYAITNVNASARTISFAHAGSDGSTGVSATVEHYPHRIAGQTTQARHFQVGGRSLVSVNDEDFEIIGGLRRRDKMQGFRMKRRVDGASEYSIYPGSGPAAAAGSTAISTESTTGDPITDGTNGTPRTGKVTEPRSMGAYLYLWGQKYVP